MLEEQVRYRELLMAVVRRDLILRYKQAALGFGWAVLVPLLNMIVFTIVFTRVTTLETDAPYPLFAYAGLLPWALFASSIRFSASSLATNRDLITKVYFPREVFVFSAVIVALVDFLVASTVLFVLMAYFGVAPSGWIFALPVILLVLMAFAAGVGLVVAMANLFYRDVKYLTEIVLTIWMFATSVLYPVRRVGGRTGELLAVLNPLTPIIEAFRAALIGSAMPEPLHLGVAGISSFVVLGIGWLWFHRAEPVFAQEI